MTGTPNANTAANPMHKTNNTLFSFRLIHCIHREETAHAEGCGHQIRQFLTGVVGRHPSSTDHGGGKRRAVTFCFSGCPALNKSNCTNPNHYVSGGLDANYVALSDSDLSGL